MDPLAEQVTGIGALAEPVRLALYRYVAQQPQPVGREQAAGAVGVPLHSAKFHLDRLVDEGVLEVEFRRLSGRTGPGAGRPSKLYRRSSRQLAVTLPPRHYDLAGDVLASAVERSVRDGVPVGDAVAACARERGRRIAESHAKAAGAAGDAAADALDRVGGLLAHHGYEPRRSDRTIRLANCPFDRLAREHTELVCGMNLALVRGVLDAVDAPGATAELTPEPGACCVTVRG